MVEPVPPTEPARRPAADAERPEPLHRAELVAVGALVALGVVLRFVTTSALWLDEALSVNIATLPVGDLVEALRRDGHPPLYYVVLGGWLDLVGDNDAAVRSLSGVLSVVTLGVVWWWTRVRVGAVAALWALALLAVLPFATRYGTEARMYALVMLLVAVGGVALVRLVERPGWAPAVVLWACATALLYTHYWALWVLAVTGVGLLWVAWRPPSARHRRSAWLGVAALVAAGVAFLPWVPVLLDQLASTGTPWSDPVRPTAAIATSLVDIAGGLLASEAVLGAAGLAVLLLLGLTGRAGERGQVHLDLGTRPTVRPELVAAGATLLLGGAVAWVTGGGFASRYAAVVVPMLAVGAGAGAAVISGAVRRVVLVGGLAALLGGVAVIGAVDQRTQAGEAARAIAADAGPDDLVAVCPDQLGPAVRRALPDPIDVVRVPDLGDPRFVDWRDYEARNDAVDMGAVAAELLDRAGDGTLWLVWVGGYRTLEGDCEALAAALGGVRRAEGVVAADGETYFEPMSVFRFAAG